MSDEMIKRIGEAVVVVELSVNAVNALLNTLNMPNQTPTTIAADLLINIEKQVTIIHIKAAHILAVAIGA